MSTNLSKIRARLKTLKESTSKTGGLWKPTAKHQVRIVPYKFNPENPFIELLFHYDLGGKNLLSPASFGEADPIIEFAEKMKATGDPESYKLYRKLMPKMRTYVPVIVRGEEDQGVRFWGFSKNNYEELMVIMDDDEYGDIADVQTGTDLDVTYITPEEAGTTFGKITVRAKRHSSKLTDDKTQLKNWLDNQKKITEVYKMLSYDELKEALMEWLEVDTSEEESTEDAAETTTNKTDILNNVKTDEAVTSATEAFNKLFERSTDKTSETVVE